ncbi:MAG: hypothetical protein ACR2O8_15655 [Rhizobiaceae bacterium]
MSSMAVAQTVSKEFEKSLNEQGFEIVSTGYTWLWRIVVHATDGKQDREILISRGSGQILQDNWRPADGWLENSADGKSKMDGSAKKPLSRRTPAQTRPQGNQRGGGERGGGPGGPGK